MNKEKQNQSKKSWKKKNNYQKIIILVSLLIDFSYDLHNPIQNICNWLVTDQHLHEYFYIFLQILIKIIKQYLRANNWSIFKWGFLCTSRLLSSAHWQQHQIQANQLLTPIHKNHKLSWKCRGWNHWTTSNQALTVMDRCYLINVNFREGKTTVTACTFLWQC